MANKHRGEITADIGGRERKLRLTLNDFAELQESCGNQPLLQILDQLDHMNVKVLRTLLFLALRHDDADLTEEQLGSFDLNIVELTLKLSECIQHSLGTGKTKGKKK